MRLLERARPDVDITLLGETTIEREHILFCPCPKDEFDGLEIALAQHARILAVGKTSVLRAPHREAGDQATPVMPERDANSVAALYREEPNAAMVPPKWIVWPPAPSGVRSR